MSNKLTKEEVFNDFEKIHGNKYDYSKFIYSSSLNKSTIICPIHGEFCQSHSHHSRGSHCPLCKNIIIGNKNRSNTEEFIKKSNIIHKNKYDYSEVNYVNNRTKINIICKLHGKFWQTPNNHLDGRSGCLRCRNEKRKNPRKDTKQTISDFIKIHGTLYDYSKVFYINFHTPVKIICSQHGPFLKSPEHHLNGGGCPKCNISKGELKVMTYLDNHNIKYIFQKTFIDCKGDKGWVLKFDFYIPSKNLLIEYDGIQHFKSTRFMNKTHIITQLEFDETRRRDKTKNSEG